MYMLMVVAETLSEAVKMLKGELCVKAIDTHNMDKALIFCRTKLDCDNMERYFNQIGEHEECVSECDSGVKIIGFAMTEGYVKLESLN